MAKILNVEIGESWVRVAAVSGSGKKGSVEDVFRFALPENLVDDGYVQNGMMVGEMLKKELEEHKLSGVKKAVFTVFSGKIVTREATVPFMKEKLLQGMLETNATEYFPIDISDYVLTYQIQGIKEEAGAKQYRLLLYASPKSIAQSCQGVAKAAGLELQKLDYIGNSVYQACRRFAGEGTHVNIFIEEYNSLVTIVENDVMALQRNVAQGMEAAFTAVRRHMELRAGTDREGALEVLRTRTCVRGRTSKALVESGYEEAYRDVTDSLQYLCANIARVIDYHISRNPDAVFSSVTLSGIGAECLGLAELLSEELSVEVTLATCLPEGSAREAIIPAGEQEGSYFAVIGSMYEPVDLKEKAEAKLSVSPSQSSLKGAFTILWLAAGVSVILSAVGIFYHVNQNMQQKKVKKEIAKLQPVQDLYDKYVRITKEHKDFLAMYSFTETPNEDLVNFIQELEDKIPSASMIASLNVTGDTVNFTMMAGSKEEAAKTLLQLRTFESLMNVASYGLSEDENGNVTYEISAMYRTPAKKSQAGAGGQTQEQQN